MSEEKLKLKIGLLNSKLREADDELLIIENKYIKERDRNDFLYKQLADSETKNRNLEKELKIYEDETVKTKNDIILKDIANKSYENKINVLNNELKTITEMNETLKKSLADLEKYVKQKENYEKDNTVIEETDLIQKELDYERDRIIKLQHDINTYKTECNRLTNQIAELEKSNIELENKLIFMSQTYMKNINPKPQNPSLEQELKIKKYEEEILTLQSQNKGLNAENLKLINENYTLRYESKKCFCLIQ
jgi:chromosome segregation ATPase